MKHSWAFVRILRRFKPDVVNFHFDHSFCFYAFLCKLCGVKGIFKTERMCLTAGDDWHQLTHRSQLSWRLRLLYLDGLVYRLSDVHFFVSRYVCRQFETVFGKDRRNRVSYIGVPDGRQYDEQDKATLRKELNISENQVVLANTSFAVYWKGVDILLRALPLLRGNCVLLLMGWNEEIPLTAEMHALAKELGVEDKIRWIGITDEVYKYLSVTDIYVQPSRTETLGLAVCEAMSYGMPCVGSDVSGLPEVCNVLFTPEDYNDLAARLNTLIADEALRHRLGRESRQAFEQKFRQQVGAAAYNSTYREVVGKKEGKGRKHQ